jgi:flavin reductase (DIM6/NTAB) family NADH-FMN oxidoreductase RutF
MAEREIGVIAPDSKQLAAALGRIPSGLFVLTLRHGEMETGMLASWVQQCSFSPPAICLAIRPDRAIAGLMTLGSFFTLNILDDTQTDMIVHFGRGFELNEPAFEGLAVLSDRSNGAILQEALAFLTCRVTGRHPSGDHDLFLAEVVVGGMLADGYPMVHVRKSGLHY